MELIVAFVPVVSTISIKLVQSIWFCQYIKKVQGELSGSCPHVLNKSTSRKRARDTLAGGGGWGGQFENTSPHYLAALKVSNLDVRLNFTWSPLYDFLSDMSIMGFYSILYFENSLYGRVFTVR